MPITTIKSDSNEFSVRLLDFGARIAGITFEGVEVALAYTEEIAYTGDSYYLGATVGPIANRIAGGRLEVCGKVFQLPQNEGDNCVHCGGGDFGLDRKVWSLVESSSKRAVYQLYYELNSIGMEGVLEVRAVYQIIGSRLVVEYISSCDADTFLNITNHVYLNLSGRGLAGENETIEDHAFELQGQSIVNMNGACIPDGTLTPMSGVLTCKLDDKGVVDGLGSYGNHYFNVTEEDAECKLMAVAVSRTSGIQVKVRSTSPGYQFYTGIALSEPFVASGGFCIETQYAPDAINQAALYSPLLLADEQCSHLTEFEFSRQVS